MSDKLSALVVEAKKNTILSAYAKCRQIPHRLYNKLQDQLRIIKGHLCKDRTTLDLQCLLVACHQKLSEYRFIQCVWWTNIQSYSFKIIDWSIYIFPVIQQYPLIFSVSSSSDTYFATKTLSFINYDIVYYFENELSSTLTVFKSFLNCLIPYPLVIFGVNNSMWCMWATRVTAVLRPTPLKPAISSEPPGMVNTRSTLARLSRTSLKTIISRSRCSRPKNKQNRKSVSL